MRLRRDIVNLSSSEKSLPPNIVMQCFIPESHAKAARALLNESYATGAGQVEAFDAWWNVLQSDGEYDPELCFVAVDAKLDTIVGFAQCWTGGFVKDFAVAAAYRRRGLGRAMIEIIVNCFAARGFAQLDLKVVPENVAAIRFYRSLGFYSLLEA